MNTAAAPFMSRIIGEDLPITLDEKVVVLEKGTHLNIDLISACLSLSSS